MTPPLRAGPPLPPAAFATLRRTLVLDHCKWDPQVGDVATVADFPLYLRRSHWRRLAADAEALAAELDAVEAELVARPALHRSVGLPWRLRRALRPGRGSPPVPRLVRFDFHWAEDGWRVSEANADVPGGLCEGSALPALMAVHCPDGTVAGDPGRRWADAVASARTAPAVALLTAPGFMEDQQVVAYVAKRLGEAGVPTHMASPANLRWAADGTADLPPAYAAGRVGAVVRFVQAEWLPRLAPAWDRLVRSATPVLNPVRSTLVESKRLPVVWDALRTPVPVWRRSLPATVDPREVAWRSDERWLLKAAYGNTGDAVAASGWTPPPQWRAAVNDARRHPGRWVAQRRFATVPVDTPRGPMTPCVGVYTVGGTAAGIYGRLSPGPVIDFAAVDVAVLVEADYGPAV